MKKLFLIVVLIIFGSYFSLNRNGNTHIFEEKYLKFGTLVSVKISDNSYSSSQEKKINKIFQKINNLLHELHIKWHPWEEHPQNVLFNLNKALQQGKKYKVDDDTINIITTSKFVAKITENLFNPMNGKLYEIWGFHKEDFSNNKIPDKKLIDEILSAKLSMDNIEINKNIISTNITDPKIRKLIKLDFNAIAKGQIMLNIKELLEKNDIHNALINIGGDIYAMGYKNHFNKTKWTTAIYNPNQDKSPYKIIELEPNSSIATSGNYFRKFKDKNKEYGHIIGINNMSRQSTVKHENPLVADAIATSLILGDTVNVEKNKNLIINKLKNIKIFIFQYKK